MLSQEILDMLISVVGEERCKTTAEDLVTYSYDGYLREFLPEAVLFPKTTEEVSGIMTIAATHGISVTPRGSGTCMTAGSLAKEGGIIICFSMMNRILEINAANRYAILEPGVVVAELQKAVDGLDLFYPPDPGSVAVATIAGTVMTNAGGMRGIKYGVTRDYLLGLEVVLPSGEVMKTGTVTCKDVAGYDLTRLLCGSEGTLALVTRVTVRLLPKPKARRTLEAIYDRLDDAGTTVAKIFEAGIIPATLELMEKTVIKAVEDFAHMGLPLDAEAILLIDVDGDPDTVERQSALVAEFCRAHGAREVHLSSSDKENEQLWAARRSVAGAMGRVRPTCIVEDSTVPVGFLTDAIKKILEVGERYSVQTAVLAHAGDGNFHPFFLCDQRDEEEMKRVGMAKDELVDYVLSVGGTVSGEHGIGIYKAKYLPKQLGEVRLKMMRSLKDAFDPKGILNPGSFLEHAV